MGQREEHGLCFAAEVPCLEGVMGESFQLKMCSLGWSFGGRKFKRPKASVFPTVRLRLHPCLAMERFDDYSLFRDEK